MSIWGYRLRSSRAFIIATISIALFSEKFLYSFIVPILSYMLVRLHVHPSEAQRYTTFLLTLHGFVALASAPIIAHFADKASSRKTPLLICLFGSLIGTLIIAVTPSVWVLVLGRVIQGLAGSATWIVGFATLADFVGQKNMGKTIGGVMSLATTGTVLGPVVSGTLQQIWGHWTAWLVTLLVLLLDFIACLFTVQRHDHSPEDGPRVPDEASSLLPSSSHSYQSLSTGSSMTDVQDISEDSPGFYRVMFSQVRVIAGVANVLMLSLIISAFDTLLPIHLRRTFDWESSSLGLVFLAFQLPRMIFGFLAGWLRDRIGNRYPTAVSWVLIGFLLWLLGVPGPDSFSWARPEAYGEPIFIACVVGIGVVSTLARGAGAVQMTAVVYELQSKHPKIFDEHGANSRVFSLIEISFNLGLMLGPLLSGSLAETVGFYYSCVALAIVSFQVGLATLIFFDDGLSV